MINVNFIGGARKSFQTDSLEITQNIETISELITYLISQKPENTPDFDGKNLLIAVNGVDSSALAGIDTKLNSNDVVNIIPIIHGGSKTNVSFDVNNHKIRLFEINKSNSNKDYLLSLRKKFPKLYLQAISSKFILDQEHAKKIISISINKKLKDQLLSEKLEVESEDDTASIEIVDGVEDPHTDEGVRHVTEEPSSEPETVVSEEKSISEEIVDETKSE